MFDTYPLKIPATWNYLLVCQRASLLINAFPKILKIVFVCNKPEKKSELKKINGISELTTGKELWTQLCNSICNNILQTFLSGVDIVQLNFLFSVTIIEIAFIFRLPVMRYTVLSRLPLFNITISLYFQNFFSLYFLTPRVKDLWHSGQLLRLYSLILDSLRWQSSFNQTEWQ